MEEKGIAVLFAVAFMPQHQDIALSVVRLLNNLNRCGENGTNTWKKLFIIIYGIIERTRV